MNTITYPKTLKEAKYVLNMLKKYRQMQKNLWKRWTDLFHLLQDGKHICRVEYHNSLSKDTALLQAIDLYWRIFSYTPTKEEILIVENNKLWGGMKIYFDDNLLDMSFKNIEKKIQKNNF